MGSAGNWRRITPAFEGDFRVLTYDQRGHGKSLKPESGYTPTDYANDLLFIFDSLKIGRAALLGHSMGGRAALQFAHLYPERVTKLIIEDIGPEPGEEFGKELIETLKSVPVPFESRVKAKEFLLNDLGDARLGNFFYTNMSVGSNGSVTWSFDINKIIETILEGRKIAPWDQVQNLKCPTLLIRGSRSTALTREQYQRILTINSNIKGVEIEGAGHWVHIDKPAEFIKVVKDFLIKGLTV
jgi:pimeloyl-ACP methyl ester carboxylesterase